MTSGQTPPFSHGRSMMAAGVFVGILLGVTGCGYSAANEVTYQPKTVTILGQLSAEDQPKFEAAMVPFEEETGIDVIYESSDNFNSLLRMRITSFNKPDLVLLPQPGLMVELADAGHLIPLTRFMNASSVKSAYSDSWLELGAVEDELYGLWFRISVQSLIWYRPTAFEAKGYDIPNTWSKLTALSNQIAADGETPWCIGLENGAASGQTGTDWIEEFLLRTAGPEVYSQWVDHRIPFNSPQVLNAFNEFGKLVQNEEIVSGGAKGAITTSESEAALGIFNNPPDCYLHRQGNPISSVFPEGKIPRVDYDAFPFPSIDPKFGSPLLVSGELMVMFNQTPESEALMKYLLTPVPHETWAKLGGFLSPHREVALEAYPDLVTQNISQILSDADGVRFDASDLMPGYVGTDIFWSGVMEFVEGKPAAEVVKEIDQSWP
ncbi:MAG: ABC transporter substrate-binding protein [Cyanobacteria bacterium J06634_6]